MAGSRKFSAPKISRLSTDRPSPASALMCCLSLHHWLMKMTTNSAVMAKSSPWVLKRISMPPSAPSVAPENQ